MTTLWLRPGTADRFQCENCLRDRRLETDLLRAGQTLCSIPIYLPLAKEAREPVFYGALRTWLGEQSHLFRCLPDFLNRWLDHPGRLAWLAGFARTHRPDQGAALTLALLSGTYDPRLDTELLSTLARDDFVPDNILLSTPLLARQGRLLHEHFKCPWYSLLGGEDHWIEQLGDDFPLRIWSLIRQETQSCSAFICDPSDVDAVIRRQLQLDQRCCSSTFHPLLRSDRPVP